MTKLHLIRHGETSWNAERRYQGSKDIPLNERGIQQAEELSRALAEMPMAGIYASDLKRAIQTAEIIKATRNLTVKIYPELREGSFGTHEGRIFDEIQAQHSHLFEQRNMLTNTEKLHFKLTPDVESGFEIVQRALPILEKIISLHPDENSIIVTHGGVIRSLLAYLLDKDWSSIHIKNAQRVTLIHKDNQFILTENC